MYSSSAVPRIFSDRQRLNILLNQSIYLVEIRSFVGVCFCKETLDTLYFNIALGIVISLGEVYAREK